MAILRGEIMQEVLEIDENDKVTKIEPSQPAGSENEIYTCSFCAETSDNDKVILIKGGSGNICSNCVALCSDILKEQLPLIKLTTKVECPHCQANWSGKNELTCLECHKNFMIAV